MKRRPKFTRPSRNEGLPIFGLRAEAVVALAALVLSLITVLTNAWFAWRGSQVSAVPPASIFFFRDGGAGAVLTAGVDTALVNTASANYGDVVTKVVMEVEGGSPPAQFVYEMLVTPVFTEQAEAQMASCPVTARCVRNGQFLAIEEPRRTLDVPGGASRSEYIGFVLQSSYCAAEADCSDYVDFEHAASALEKSPTLNVRFRYSLQNDGEKVALCKVRLWGGSTGRERGWLTSHLTRSGWLSLPCE